MDKHTQLIHNGWWSTFSLNIFFFLEGTEQIVKRASSHTEHTCMVNPHAILYPVCKLRTTTAGCDFYVFALRIRLFIGPLRSHVVDILQI